MCGASCLVLDVLLGPGLRACGTLDSVDAKFVHVS